MSTDAIDPEAIRQLTRELQAATQALAEARDTLLHLRDESLASVRAAADEATSRIARRAAAPA